MMGCRETRKACCLVLAWLGRPGLAQHWPRVIGQRAVNPVTAETSRDPVATQDIASDSGWHTGHS